LIVTIEQIEKEMRTAMQPEKVVAAGNESGNQESCMLFVFPAFQICRKVIAIATACSPSGETTAAAAYQAVDTSS
jgi:hypothetical protein